MTKSDFYLFRNIFLFLLILSFTFGQSALAQSSVNEDSDSVDFTISETEPDLLSPQDFLSEPLIDLDAYKKSLEDIDFVITPNIPEPEQLVKVRANNFLVDIKRANISWHINGVYQEGGIGERTFYFNAPKAGEEMRVSIIVEEYNGVTIERSFVIAPASVDIIIEAENYTPPFYKGKSVPSDDVVLNVVAIPNFVENGIKLDSKNVIFTWEIGNWVQADLSGLGKDSIRINSKEIPGFADIVVIAESLTSSLTARKRIEIEEFGTELIVYENNPLQGIIYNKALNDMFNFERSDLSVSAIPYFFNINKKDDRSIKYYWLENGDPILDSLISNTLNIKNKRLDEDSFSNISVSAKNLDNLSQSSFNKFSLSIPGKNTLNLRVRDNDQNETTIF